MSTKATVKPSIKTVLQAVVSLGEQIQAVKGELETKIENSVETAKEEILKEVRPIAKAVDKDALTIVKYDKRITRIESHLSLK